MRALVIGLVACAACGGDGGDDSLPARHAHAWIEEAWAPAPVRLDAVLAVDDAAGVAFRQAVLAGLRRSLGDHLELQGFPDPAMWVPLDVRVALVFPSRDGAQRFADEPALHLVRDDAHPADLDALVDAVAAQLAAHPAPPGAPYRLLEALSEVEVDGSWPIVALASLRDDESPLAATAYAPRPESFRLSAIVPSAACDAGSIDLPRIAAFMDGAWLPDVHPWPCVASSLADDGLVSKLHVDGARQWCPSRPIAVDPDGRAQCRVVVDTDDCDPARGWHEVDGRCEVLQLEGAARDACRHTLACEGCGSGWCASEVVDFMDFCDTPSGLRFTGKSLSGAGAKLTIACELDG